jgi:hypothetical protein
MISAEKQQIKKMLFSTISRKNGNYKKDMKPASDDSKF